MSKFLAHCSISTLIYDNRIKKYIFNKIRNINKNSNYKSVKLTINILIKNKNIYNIYMKLYFVRNRQ